MPEYYVTKRGISSSVTSHYIGVGGGGGGLEVKMAISSVTYFLNDLKTCR